MIESELRAAVAARIIVPYYQPVVELKTRRVESVSRHWRAGRAINSGGSVPDVFITVAEEISELLASWRSIVAACTRMLCAWPPDLTLAFNISAVQLRDPAIGLRILAILAETGLSPRRLELEITETALVDNMTVAQNVTNRLREAGVRIALDDFGTGMTPVSSCRSSWTGIKIDRNFVIVSHDKGKHDHSSRRAWIGRWTEPRRLPKASRTMKEFDYECRLPVWRRRLSVHKAVPANEVLRDLLRAII